MIISFYFTRISPWIVENQQNQNYFRKKSKIKRIFKNNLYTMKDLGIKLNPITKLRIFREVKKIIFTKMDSDKITPERAEEILDYVKKYVVDIETPERAKQFYLHLGEKFDELKEIKQKFEIEEEEKIDQVFSLLIDEFMEKGNMDLASEIMEQMNEVKNGKIYLEKLKTNHPIEFQKALKKIL